MQESAEVLEAEKRWRYGRYKIFPMHESIGALSEAFVVPSGKIGAARTWHPEREDGLHAAGTILLDLMGCQRGQCAAETMSGDDDTIADRHGLTEKRFQSEPNCRGCPVVTTGGPARDDMGIEIRNPVREYQRVGTGEGYESCAPSSRNKAMGAGFWQSSFNFLDNNPIFDERQPPDPQHVFDLVGLIRFVSKLGHPRLGFCVAQAELWSAHKSVECACAVALFRKLCEETHLAAPVCASLSHGPAKMRRARSSHQAQVPLNLNPTQAGPLMDLSRKSTTPLTISGYNIKHPNSNGPADTSGASWIAPESVQESCYECRAQRIAVARQEYRTRPISAGQKDECELLLRPL